MSCLFAFRSQTEIKLIVHSTYYLFSDWPKAYSELFFEFFRHLAADYTIIMSRTLKVTGNLVMYHCGA